jgi:hypothetical protein
MQGKQYTLQFIFNHEHQYSGHDIILRGGIELIIEAVVVDECYIQKIGGLNLELPWTITFFIIKVGIDE